VRLFKGQATTVRRQSPFSLYSEDFATFGADEVYNQKHAEGFIRLLTLPERIAAFNGLHLAETRKSALVDQRGLAPVVGPRTGPVVEPDESPVSDPIIKEGKAL
jgi:Tfp pilus assembly ATPase PilU